MTELAPRSINPATGELLGERAFMADAGVESLLQRAATVQRAWGVLPSNRRAAALTTIANALRREIDDLARLITLEMGKPLPEARAEVAKAAGALDYAVARGPDLLEDRPSADAPGSYVSYLPYGVLLAVMPWNFPVWQVVRFAASALMCGNVVVLKHAPNVQGVAERLAEIFDEADVGASLLSNLIVDTSAVARCIADSRIAGVAFTGSVRAGFAVAGAAGGAGKKSLLELGGSDPLIVLEDADIAAAAQAAAAGRFTNCGQVCIAPKRMILVGDVAERFEAALIEAVRALSVGDPMSPETRIGPMARGDLRAELASQVQATLAEGADLVAGGASVPGPGFFYSPTILANVRPHMTAAREELFGPVAALIRVADADEALALANATPFGLSSSIWTSDLNRARGLARRIEAGGVFINQVSVSDPRLPIGGVKLSGYGRELGEAGFREFVNVQTVRMGPGA